MLKEFKEFAIRGNVLDLAVAVVIGAAFGKVVTSFVEDILMPPIGRLAGRVDFSSMFISLDGQHYNSIAAAKAAGAPTLNYGLFINSVITFVIIAFTVFLLLRQVNRFKAKPAPAPASKECPRCFTVIPLKATRCPNCTSELAA
ncbi:MAG TPA: large conductance mechanosensitive channel protein MscL [Candidatus Dormibacteraeota bacterium]|nr:large conductance mechanosensitive channel protein MscL [Candidatus Dormibacteraeota bacterium]